MNHRDSWAEERTSPSKDEWMRDQAEERAPASSAGAPSPAQNTNTAPKPGSIASSAGAKSVMPSMPSQPEREILIVASKLKDYIRARSGMNTSANVMDELSDRVRQYCDEAIQRANQDGRKTVLDRDFVKFSR